MYSCGAKSRANLYRGRSGLYIVSVPERTASGRQAGNIGGSSPRPAEDETGPCPSWPSILDVSLRGERRLVAWPPCDDAEDNARLR